jgi:outer membrane protein assembly factor BamB
MTTKEFSVGAVLALMAAAGSPTGVVGADWPSFRGPSHDGRTAETLAWPNGGPKQRWKINVGIGHSAVSVVGDRAYTMGNTNDTDTVFSIDVATGKIVWTYSWEQVGLSSHWHTGGLVNGYLFGPDGNNSEGAGRSPTSLRCLAWKTGEIKWTEPKLGFNGLIAVGGQLLVLTETGDLVLAEASPRGYKELGSMHVIGGRAFTAPVFANGKVYARNTKGDVVCVDFGGK